MFDDAQEVDLICYEMRYGEWLRGQYRARINSLMNGDPPYSLQEVQENGISININDLSGTRLAHDARAQFYSAFCKPGNFFKASTDSGPVHKRDIWSTIVTKEINRPMKRSISYFEKYRSTIASDVLHGIGPSVWRDRDRWCPKPMGVEDVLVPANICLPMDNDNLPFFAVHRSMTGPELKRLTRNAPKGSESFNGWNMPLVESLLEWIDSETQTLMGTLYPEIWTPEKIQERKKADGGSLGYGDNAPTIELFDFYFWNDDDKVEGWNRRMIIDAWSAPQDYGAKAFSRRAGDLFNRNSMEFVFNSKKRKYARQRDELITWQFADLSAVSPFRYHSIRGIGFMLFAVCHMQNRLRCSFNRAVFETLNMLYRVRNESDVQRALKLNITDKGFVDESIEFIPQEQRWNPNANLAELGLQENQRLIEANSSSYTQNRNQMADKREKTATQVMAEVNAMTSLVSAALMQAYKYAEEEDREIFRRFCRRNSTDPDVRDFQARCMTQGVPLKYLVPEAWDIEHDRIMGAGNKTLEMAIAQQLLEIYEKLDPGPQRTALRKVILSTTDDAALAMDLVPEDPVKITDSVHDAQVAMGAILQGLPMGVKEGINHVEYVDAAIPSLAQAVQNVRQTGSMTPKDLKGFIDAEQHIAAHIEIVAKDPTSQNWVKQQGKLLGQVMNEVKTMAAQLQKQQASQNGQSGMDPKDVAKAQAMVIQAQTKAKLTSDAHAQRTAQRQIQFQQKFQQDKLKANLDIRKQAAQATLDLQREHLKHRMNTQKADESES